MKNWQFWILIAVLVLLGATMDRNRNKLDTRLQYIQEVLEEQWTLMDSSAYEEIDRYKDMPEEELFEADKF